MQFKEIDKKNLPLTEDLVGNNAAFTCPVCRQVFIVSTFAHRGKRMCPTCQKSVGYCDKDSENLRIEWEDTP